MTTTEGSNQDQNEPLVIGENEASVREGIEHVVSRDDDLEPGEYQRQLDHVKDVCFGWFDETCDECVKHCRLASACAERRNEHLADFAEEAEQRDKSAKKFHDLENRMENIESLRDEVDGGLEDWADEGD